MSTEDISSRLTSAIADYDPDVSSTDDLITLLQDARREIERLHGESAAARDRVDAKPAVATIEKRAA